MTTSQLPVQCNDVFGFRAFHYERYTKPTDCGYLFAARPQLFVLIEDGDFQTLASEGGVATLLTVRLQRRRSTMSLTTPDFGKMNLWPHERPARRTDVELEVSGEALLRRVSAKPLLYAVVVGMLRCDVAPMFEALRPRGGQSALMSFWPSLPQDADGLSFVFTQFGLAVEGELDVATARRETLLLPQRDPGNADGDVAWGAFTGSWRTEFWENLDGADTGKSMPNRAALVEQMRDDAPDPGTWPYPEPTWAILRWRVVTPERQPLLEHCFASWAPGVRLERLAQDAGAAGAAGHAALVMQYWVSRADGQLRLEHGGAVCALAGMEAHCQWSADGRNSVFSAGYARCGLWFAAQVAHAPAALLTPVRITLRSAPARAGAPNLSLSWPDDESPSPHNVRLELERTPLRCGGPQANDGGAPPAPASWLALDGGCIQLGAGSLPLDTDTASPAADLLAASADAPQAFRGGLPLDELGGPEGLSAWVTAGADGGEPQALLRIARDAVTLQLYDAVVIWRTPAWWLCGPTAPAGTARLPALGAAFLDPFSVAPGSDGDADRRLLAALGSQLFPTLWTGRAGAAPGSDESTWTLQVSGAAVHLEMPAKAAAAATLWTAFRDHYLVQTVPAGGQAPGGPLLDPGRGLVPLACPDGEVLALTVRGARLPVLEPARYPAPGKLSAGWKVLGGEMFHPNIPGLTLAPRASSYTFLHGPPILCDGYLRARADGSLGWEWTQDRLEMVRTDDDVALAGLPVGALPGRQFELAGWLPHPHAVRVSDVSIVAGGDKPGMEFIAAGGKDGSERLRVRIASDADGFEHDVFVSASADGAAAWLTADGKAGKALRNFGQPLLVLPAGEPLMDGAGRRWAPFAQGQRRISSHAGVENLLTGARAGELPMEGIGSAHLVLNLVDVDLAGEPGRGAWDLSALAGGEPGGMPMIGPFPVLADRLVQATATQATLVARLGPPRLPGAPMSAAGAMRLSWTRDAASWRLALEAASFEWRVEPAPDGSVTALHSLSGRMVAADGGLRIEVDSVRFVTLLGVVRIVCAAAPLRYTWDGDTCTGFSADVRADRTGGLEADFVLECRLPTPADETGGWTIRRADGGPPHVDWVGSGDTVLSLGLGPDTSLTLYTGAVRWPLEVAQAARERWLVSMSAREGEPVELAGCLERQEAGDDGLSTQVRLAYRTTTKVADLAALFGPCEEGSWARADTQAAWQSARLSAVPGVAAENATVLTGCLILSNSFGFALAQPDGAPPARVDDEVRCYFDRLPLDTAGAVKGGVLHAIVEHRLVSSADRTTLSRLQVPQAVDIKRDANGDIFLACASVVLVRPGRDADALAVAPQVAYGLDPVLGVRAGQALGQAQVEGALVRLPLRTGGARSVLRVPAPVAPGLAWFPVRSQPVQAPEQEKGAGIGFWHQRRALAFALCADAIAEWAKLQVPASFAGGAALPADGEVLAEWGILHAPAGWYETGLLAAPTEVGPTPFYAGCASANTADGPEALPVGLYVPDAAIAGGLRLVTRALVAGATRGAVEQWASGELVRRSLRSSALAVAAGRPELTSAVRRSFLAAALDDVDPAPPLQEQVAVPAFSHALDLLRPAEAPPAADTVPPLVARTDQDAVLEVADARPVASGRQGATRFRLLLNAYVEAAGAAGEPGPGAAVSKRQHVAFAARGKGLDGTALPLIRREEATRGGVSPVQVDATLWSVRPGDMTYTRWSLRQAGSCGPSLDVALRAPRGRNDARAGLRLRAAANATVGGVGWVLYEASAASILGERTAYPENQAAIAIALVTPQDSLQEPVPWPAAGYAAKRLKLAVASSGTGTALRRTLAEPLLAGLVPLFTSVPAALADAYLAWAVVDGDVALGAPDQLDPAGFTDVDTLERNAALRESWNDGKAIRGVRLGDWQRVAARDNGAPPESAQYSQGVGASLARLLRMTNPLQAATASSHWLLRDGQTTPRLAVLIRKGTALSGIWVAVVEWQERSMTGQPDRMLVVHGDRVIGFGDLDGPAGISLEGDAYVLRRNAYALAAQTGDEPALPVRAWMFGSGGACAGTAHDQRGRK